MALRSGDVFANRFEIEYAAGTGGMGTVYRAIDRSSGRRSTWRRSRLVASRDLCPPPTSSPSVASYTSPGLAQRTKKPAPKGWLFFIYSYFPGGPSRAPVGSNQIALSGMRLLLRRGFKLRRAESHKLPCAVEVETHRELPGRGDGL
jgi:hypothetical protein